MTSTRCWRFKQPAAIKFGLTSFFYLFLDKYAYLTLKKLNVLDRYKSSPILARTKAGRQIMQYTMKLGKICQQVESQNKT